MTILVQELRAEIEQLKAETADLRDALAYKVIDSAKLRSFVPDDGGFKIGLEGGPCALLADAFGEQLYTSDAINYLQLTFTSGAYPDLGEIVVTLQRCTGKTPHELRIDAEQARDLLKVDADRFRHVLRQLPATLSHAFCGENLCHDDEIIEAIDQAMTKEQQP